MKAVIETHGHLRWLLQPMERDRLARETFSAKRG